MLTRLGVAAKMEPFFTLTKEGTNCHEYFKEIDLEESHNE